MSRGYKCSCLERSGHVCGARGGEGSAAGKVAGPQPILCETQRSPHCLLLSLTTPIHLGAGGQTALLLLGFQRGYGMHVVPALPCH